MANLTVVPADVRIVRMFEMLPDGPVNEAVNGGVPVRYDATTGYYTKANGTTATEAAARGIACNSAEAANLTISVMKRGVLDVGDALDTLAYAVPVYLSDTDGTLADTPGTVSTVVGYVIPGWGDTAGDKLLLVNF